MTEHDYITVGGRRWCLGCNTYQVFKGGRWRDGFPPEPWPGYEATQARCPRGRTMMAHIPRKTQDHA